MAFTIPNTVDAESPKQAEPDKVDVDILVAGIGGTSVVSGCLVTAQGSPDMTVAVASGTVRVGTTTAAVSAGNLTIGTADATNPRFDLIAVNNVGTKSVVAGTPAAAPVFAAIPADSVILAAVFVPAAATQITTARITDKRVLISVVYRNSLPVVSLVGMTSGYRSATRFPATGQSSVVMAWTVPGDYAGGDLTVRFWRRADGASGTAVMVRDVARFRDATAASSIDDAVAMNFTPGDTLSHTTSFTIAAAGFQVGDSLFIALSRDGNDAGDTLAAVAFDGGDVSYLSVS